MQVLMQGTNYISCWGQEDETEVSVYSHSTETILGLGVHL